LNNWFEHFSRRLAALSGRASTFLLAVSLVVLWALTGPIFGYSDTWQLVINTSTTVVTFLMVFLIQNTQNRDTAAMQIKLDELIRSTKGAHNALLSLEALDQEHLDAFQRRYQRLAIRARDEMVRGMRDTGSPELDDDAQDKGHQVMGVKIRAGVDA
jgi:low affinity Fe/Cu permease